jgi:hypothetical protein
MESFRCPISVHLSRPWNPGPKRETQCRFIEVLKPRSWDLGAKYWGLETQVMRAKCNNAGLQTRVDCVWPSQVPTSLIYKVTCLSVRASVITRRREKWREKDKTTIGWRAFEVMKLRSWEWNPVPVYRGLETQVLRVKPSVRLSESENPSLESQISRLWNTGPESQVLRAKCSNTAATEEESRGS